MQSRFPYHDTFISDDVFKDVQNMYSNDALPDKIEVFKCMDEKTDCTLHEHFLSSKKYEVSPVGFFQDMLFAAGIVKQCSRQSSLE